MRLNNTVTTLLFAVFATPVTLVAETTSYRYQSHVDQYDALIETNVDGTHNANPPLAQFYIVLKAKN